MCHYLLELENAGFNIYADLIGFKTPTELTVCSYHVTYAFKSESTLYGCMNVKELLARNRHKI